MEFRTQIPIAKTSQPIDYNSQILSLGSCFAINIAEKLEYFKFANECNPFGILFHPAAILNILQRVVSDRRFTEADVFQHQELWHSFEIHSDLNQPNKQVLLQRLNQQLDFTKHQLSSATHLIITYGTAWVYREKTSNAIVANCHKVPQHQFEKELLSVDICRKSIAETIELVAQINPNCQLLFTVSPVRHIKDGFVENQRSKAHLIAALHEAMTLTRSAEYFPSYEILMDELRDYRFYAKDMLHPNATATEYIWQRFSETHIANAAAPTMQNVADIRRAMDHKPFHPESESHQQFLLKLKDKMEQLHEQFPHMQF